MQKNGWVIETDFDRHEKLCLHEVCGERFIWGRDVDIKKAIEEHEQECWETTVRYTDPELAARVHARKDEVDAVYHPPHYKAHPSGVECIEITEHMNFCLGNALKYIWRAGLKGDAIEDLKKARWYIEREIQRREKE
jgi:hypothetical protein